MTTFDRDDVVRIDAPGEPTVHGLYARVVGVGSSDGVPVYTVAHLSVRPFDRPREGYYRAFPHQLIPVGRDPRSPVPEPSADDSRMEVIASDPHEPNSHSVGVRPPKRSRVVKQAQEKGYSGNLCGRCGSDRMKRTGTCETCEDCGDTSGGCA